MPFGEYIAATVDIFINSLYIDSVSAVCQAPCDILGLHR